MFFKSKKADLVDMLFDLEVAVKDESKVTGLRGRRQG